MIGSSRFTDYNEKTSSVEIGFTFLARQYWGGEYNRELKSLMLGYAFEFVDTVYFVVGNKNYRSQRAMTKLGGVLVPDTENLPLSGDLSTSVVYQIKRTDWLPKER